MPNPKTMEVQSRRLVFTVWSSSSSLSSQSFSVINYKWNPCDFSVLDGFRDSINSGMFSQPFARNTSEFIPQVHTCDGPLLFVHAGYDTSGRTKYFPLIKD